MCRVSAMGLRRHPTISSCPRHSISMSATFPRRGRGRRVTVGAACRGRVAARQASYLFRDAYLSDADRGVTPMRPQGGAGTMTTSDWVR